MTTIQNHPPKDMETLLSEAGIIPVIALSDAGQAVDLAGALTEAGLMVLEITLRNDSALESISRISRELPAATVGAGTVLNSRDLAEVAAAGARFAVSPGATADLYQDARADTAPPLVPGVATASDIMLGLAYGYRCFKFFPAAAAGGPAMLRAWQGPFAGVRFMPTGGIGPDQARDYLQLSNVLAIGGSWMLPPDAIAAGDWARIRHLATLAVQSQLPGKD